MKRKRKSLPSCGDRGEYSDRRTTLRKRSGLTYTETDFGHEEEYGDDEDEEYEHDEKEEEIMRDVKKDGEQPGKSSSHDTIALEDIKSSQS